MGCKENLVHTLMAKYPEKSIFSEQLMRNCLEEFHRVFDIDTANSTYCCGTLDKLSLMIGRDYRSSDLLFDIAENFDINYDPEIWHPDDCWESAIQDVVGEEVFENVFEEGYCMEKYRVVLTCFAPGEKPYCETLAFDPLFANSEDAYSRASSAASEECAGLNGEDDGNPPNVGCFEIDDCANNDFEVRWYEKKPEERDEGDCDIEYVTTYNVYPLKFNEDGTVCSYRGFEIKQSEDLYNVYHNATCFGGGDNLNDALLLADDICLACAENKTYALEAVHKVPLDIVIKFADQQQKVQCVSASDEPKIEACR